MGGWLRQAAATRCRAGFFIVIVILGKDLPGPISSMVLLDGAGWCCWIRATCHRCVPQQRHTGTVTCSHGSRSMPVAQHIQTLTKATPSRPSLKPDKLSQPTASPRELCAYTLRMHTVNNITCDAHPPLCCRLPGAPSVPRSTRHDTRSSIPGPRYPDPVAPGMEAATPTRPVDEHISDAMEPPRDNRSLVPSDRNEALMLLALPPPALLLCPCDPGLEGRRRFPACAG
eukprot:jgi/Ulvmu1/6834/UM031_0039.1